MASSRLADKAVLIAIGNAIQNFGVAAIGLFLVRIFDDRATYGAYRKVWLVVYTTLPFFLAAIPQSVYYFIPGLSKGERWPFMRRGILFLLGIGFALSLVMFFGAEWIAHLFKEPGIADSIRNFALYPAFTAPAMMLFPYLVSIDRHRLGVALNVGFFVTQSTLIVVLAALGTPLPTIFGVLVALALGRFVVGAIESRRPTRDVPNEPLSVSSPAMWAYAIPLALSSVASVLGQRVDKLVVSMRLSTETFAIYDVGSVEFPTIVLVAMASTSVMLPHMSGMFHSERLQEVYRFWRESYRKLSLVTVPMVVYLMVFADELMVFLYTEEYAATAHIIRFYLIVAFFRVANGNAILLATNRTRLILIGTIAFLSLNLVLNLLLVGPLGVSGPALATVIAMFLLVVYYNVQASRVLSISARSMFPVVLLVAPTAAAVLAALAALPIRRFDWAPFPTLALTATIFAVVYAVLGGVLRAIRPSDYQIALRWITLKGFRG